MVCDNTMRKDRWANVLSVHVGVSDVTCVLIGRSNVLVMHSSADLQNERCLLL